MLLSITNNIRSLAGWFISLTNHKQINEKAKEELVVKLIGGPEAIPGMEQYEAVASGMMDLNFTSSNYYMKKLPECEALALSQYDPSKEREVGFIKFLQDVHREKMEIYVSGGVIWVSLRGSVAVLTDFFRSWSWWQPFSCFLLLLALPSM